MFNFEAFKRPLGALLIFLGILAAIGVVFASPSPFGK